MTDPSSDVPGAPAAGTDLLDRLDEELTEIGRRVARARGDLEGLRPALGLPPASPPPASPPPASPPAASPPPASPPRDPGVPVASAPPRAPRWQDDAAGPPSPPSVPGPPPVPGSPPTPPSVPRPPSAPAPGPSAPGPSAPGPAASGPPPRSAPVFPPPFPPPPPARRAASPATTTARLLGIAGGVVTLLGVVLLLVLAANRGWFGPGARVVGGAVLGSLLVGAGMRLHPRARERSAADPGAVALVATGAAALFLTVAAATSLYDLLPVPLGLLLALAVVGGGLALADRWRHRGLALGVVLGGGLGAPLVVTDASPLLGALLIVVALAALPLARRRGWPLVADLAIGVAALGALAVAVRHAAVGTELPGSVAVVVGVLVLGVVTALLAASAPAGTGRGVAAVAGPVVPLLVLAAVATRTTGAVLAGVTGAALVAAAVLAARGLLPAVLRAAPPLRAAVSAVLSAAGSVLLLEAALLALRGAVQGGAVLGGALVGAVAAAALRRRRVLLPAAGFALVGVVLALVRDLSLVLLVDAPDRTGPGATRPRAELLGSAAVALLVVGVAVALLVAVHRLVPRHGSDATAPAGAVLGVVGLYGVTGLLVTGSLLVSPTRGGFLVGHALATVSWTLLALVLLVRGLRSPLLRVLGAVLVVAALAKLVLFDLTALDGIARVAAFLGAGIVLLVAGARYARLVAAQDADAPTGPQPVVAGPGPGGRRGGPPPR